MKRIHCQLCRGFREALRLTRTVRLVRFRSRVCLYDRCDFLYLRHESVGSFPCELMSEICKVVEKSARMDDTQPYDVISHLSLLPPLPLLEVLQNSTFLNVYF